MGSATEPERSGRCGCGHDLNTIAALLREALAIVERPHSYGQGVADWAQQIRNQRTQRPQQRVSASGPGAPRAARTQLARGGQP